MNRPAANKFPLLLKKKRLTKKHRKKKPPPAWLRAANALGGDSVVAFSFLLFNLLCAPCFAAMGAMRREMNSAKWTWFAILWLCGWAYYVAFLVYQLGILVRDGTFGAGQVVALIGLAGGIYLIFRKAAPQEINPLIPIHHGYIYHWNPDFPGILLRHLPHFFLQGEILLRQLLRLLPARPPLL